MKALILSNSMYTTAEAHPQPFQGVQRVASPLLDCVGSLLTLDRVDDRAAPKKFPCHSELDSTHTINDAV
jgi:hypothetical protein